MKSLGKRTLWGRGAVVMSTLALLIASLAAVVPSAVVYADTKGSGCKSFKVEWWDQRGLRNDDGDRTFWRHPQSGYRTVPSDSRCRDINITNIKVEDDSNEPVCIHARVMFILQPSGERRSAGLKTICVTSTNDSQVKAWYPLATSVYNGTRYMVDVRSTEDVYYPVSYSIYH